MSWAIGEESYSQAPRLQAGRDGATGRPATVRAVQTMSAFARGCASWRQERRRFGYRRLHLVLKRQGVTINWKKLYRLYREERLTVNGGSITI